MADNASETTPLINAEKGKQGGDGECGGGGGKGGGKGGSSSSSRSSATSIFKSYIQPSLAEMFGVMLYVFVGTASKTANFILAEALVHGLTLAVAIAGMVTISGGHINPAITFGAWIGGGIRPALAICYFFAQILGGILGAACCRGMMDYYIVTADNTTVLMYDSIKGAVHQLGPGVSLGCGVFCEIMITMVLVMSVLMLAVDSGGRNPSAPLLIGFSATIGMVAGGAISGGSMNPARSFGPAVVMSDLDGSVWQDHWIYWVGPLSGALLAGIIYRIVFASSDKRLAFKGD